MRSFQAGAIEGVLQFCWRRERGVPIGRRTFLKASTAAVGVALGSAPLPVRGAEDASAETHDEGKASKPSLPKELLAARCPVSGDRVSAEVSLDYLGGKVYFCCPDCIRKFKSDRSKYEAKARAQLVITGQFKQVRCPVDGKEVAPAIRARIYGVDVRFCSAQCAKKVRQASPEERIEWVFVKGFSNGFAAKHEATVAGRAGTDADEERWECTVCGYVHRGSAPPSQCPKCHSKSDAFVRKT